MTGTASLTAALAHVQADLPTIAKSNTAKVETRTGGSYSYHFADLASISREVLPLLAGVGLAWVCGPTLDGGQFVLRWELRHVSGETIVGTYPLPTNGSPQELGSAITYGRRYCLTSVVGIAPEDDDDGAAASQHRPPARKATSTRRASAQPAEEDRPEKLPDHTRRKLMALFGQIGLSGDKDRAARLQLASEWVGRPLGSANELNAREAAVVIAALEARIAEPPAGHDDGPTS